MKKFAAALVALALLLSAAALAFNGQGYPAWDGKAIPDSGLNGAFGQDRIALKFDPASEYSNVESGVIQACFFAYDAPEEHYVELYLLLPLSAHAGDVFRSGEGLKCSICLYETALTDEVFYYAGDLDGSGDGNSSYELRVDAMVNDGTYISMRGQFTAVMCRGAQGNAAPETLNVSDAYFGFTLPLAQTAPTPTPAPNGDVYGFATPTPLPGLTTPTPGLETPVPGLITPEPGQKTTVPWPETSEAPLPGFSIPSTAPRSNAPAFTLPPKYASL